MEAKPAKIPRSPKVPPKRKGPPRLPKQPITRKRPPKSPRDQSSLANDGEKRLGWIYGGKIHRVSGKAVAK